MKTNIFLSLLFSLAMQSQASSSNGVLANRMEHCEVVSVAGSWAMAHYPKSIDLYYGKLTGQSEWEGFLVFGFSSNDPRYPLDKLSLYPVRIQNEQTATYVGDTATGTTQDIRFRKEKYDDAKGVSVFTLKYIQDEGKYECQRAWPMGIPH